MDRLPTVAVVGCPNAGKSTLINRLSGTRTAVVDRQPGVTRDRKAVEAEWAGRAFWLVDTGGFDVQDESILAGDVRDQVHTALGDADLVLFVLDGRAGPLANDYAIADLLRRSGLPTLLVANKIDDPAKSDEAGSLYELGLGDPLAVSALHGLATGDLLDRIIERLPAVADPAPRAAVDELPVAIVGRPNAGKSSLLNAIAGERRAIVSDLPGTTRDSIDTTLVVEGRTWRFVDTAGMRKMAKMSGVEYYSYLRSLAALDRAHVAIVVLDAVAGLGLLDLRIAGEAMRRGCATVLAVNKCDAAQPDFDELRGIARRKLRQRPRVLPVSALTGEGLDPLLLLVADLQSRYTAHIPTPPLNRLLGEITGRRAMPGRGRKRLKTYFVVQHATTPPRFVVDVNDRSLVTRDFGFFVENCIRETFALDGVPVIIEFKEK